MKSAPTTATARRRAAPKQTAETSSTETPVDQAPFAHALRVPAEWQSSLTEPWVEMTRGLMEMWSSWSQASTQMQMEAWRSLGLQMPTSMAPTAEQLAAFWPWLQQGDAQAPGRSNKRG